MTDNILSRQAWKFAAVCRSGHGFFGEYYAKFVPSENSSCPCGMRHQTRAHILTECPLYADHHHLLSDAVPSMHIPDLIGTDKGISAVAEFLRNTGAFTKTNDSRANDSTLDTGIAPDLSIYGLPPPTEEDDNVLDIDNSDYEDNV